MEEVSIITNDSLQVGKLQEKELQEKASNSSKEMSDEQINTNSSEKCSINKSNEEYEEDDDDEGVDNDLKFEDEKSESRSKHKNFPKQKWLLIEDAKLKELVKIFGEDWPSISKQFPNRTRKQCRERWHLQLNPAIKKG